MCSCWQKYTVPCLAAYRQESCIWARLTCPSSHIHPKCICTLSLIKCKKRLGMQVQCWLLRQLSKLTLIWKGRVCLGFFRLPLSCSCHYVKQVLIPCQGVQACHLTTSIHVILCKIMPQKLIQPQMRKAFK